MRYFDLPEDERRAFDESVREFFDDPELDLADYTQQYALLLEDMEREQRGDPPGPTCFPGPVSSPSTNKG